MKIVIDVDENVYTRLFDNGTETSDEDRKVIDTAVRKGKPLVIKTGNWIEQDGLDGDVHYDCSVCGESWTTIEGTPWDNDMNYCPHCGAKMEGAEEQDKKKQAKMRAWVERVNRIKTKEGAEE